MNSPKEAHELKTMMIFSRQLMPLISLLYFLMLPQLVVAEKSQVLTVKNIAELELAVSRARPGRVIQLANGMYNQVCHLQAQGTGKDSIIVRAQRKGGVQLSNLVNISGRGLTLSGFHFTGKGAVYMSGQAFRLTACRMVDVQQGKWVRVAPGSREVEIDHCVFEKKTINRVLDRDCQLIQIIVRNQRENHHIHHNQFRNVLRGKKRNGYETVQVITEKNPFDPPPGHAQTIIEDNFFEACNGESEIISIKSNGNLIRRNTFKACRGYVVLRHGDENTVVGNIFMGEIQKNTGGVRLQGADHMVANNYFYELTRSAVVVMDGTPDKLYVQVERARILHNSFINCKTGLEIGKSHSKGHDDATPRNCVVGNNLFFVDKSAKKSRILHLINNDQPDQWTWFGNIADGNLFVPQIDGFSRQNTHLTLIKNGLSMPTAQTPLVQKRPNMAMELDSDLLGQARAGARTVGAVEFTGSPLQYSPITSREKE